MKTNWNKFRHVLLSFSETCLIIFFPKSKCGGKCNPTNKKTESLIVPVIDRSPGFGLTLVAETNNGVFLCADCTSNPKGSDAGVTIPEDLGKKASYLLLEEIYRVTLRYILPGLHSVHKRPFRQLV